MDEPRAIVTAVATRQGTREHNADAAQTFRASDGTIAAALVDGIGDSPQLAAGMERLAWAAARLAAQLDGRSALVTVGRIVADPGAEDEPEADGPGIVAVVHPDGDVVVHWLGDCRAYGWDGTVLTQHSTDHTMGECLRVNSGHALPEYKAHDNWVLSVLSRALPTTVAEVVISDADVVLLTSDGVHDQVPHDMLEALVRDHQGDAQVLADAIVAAARADEDGYRDDATVVVLRHVTAGANPL
jgi:serine/threonine protein phosphatase PrpC